MSRTRDPFTGREWLLFITALFALAVALGLVYTLSMRNEQQSSTAPTESLRSAVVHSPEVIVEGNRMLAQVEIEDSAERRMRALERCLYALPPRNRGGDAVKECRTFTDSLYEQGRTQ